MVRRSCSGRSQYSGKVCTNCLHGQAKGRGVTVRPCAQQLPLQPLLASTPCAAQGCSRAGCHAHPTRVGRRGCLLATHAHPTRVGSRVCLLNTGASVTKPLGLQKPLVVQSVRGQGPPSSLSSAKMLWYCRGQVNVVLQCCCGTAGGSAMLWYCRGLCDVVALQQAVPALGCRVLGLPACWRQPRGVDRGGGGKRAHAGVLVVGRGRAVGSRGVQAHGGWWS